jgi:hypothetical protein
MPKQELRLKQVCVIATFALLTCGALGSQLGRASEIPVRPERYFAFHVGASNGYSVSVVTDGRRHLILDVSGPGGRVAYRSLAHVTDDGIFANIGRVGRVAMRFVPGHSRAVKVEPGCQGPPMRVERGSFRGSFRFRGESGFTEVSLRHVPGEAAQTFGERCEQPEPQGQVGRILESRAHGSVGSVTFIARDRGGGPEFEARTLELHPRLTIERLVIVGGSSEQFVGSKKADQIRVQPPFPFSGEATLDVDHHALKGSLRVEMLGRPQLALTGSQFVATFAIHSGLRQRAEAAVRISRAMKRYGSGERASWLFGMCAQRGTEA